MLSPDQQDAYTLPKCPRSTLLVLIKGIGGDKWGLRLRDSYKVLSVLLFLAFSISAFNPSNCFLAPTIFSCNVDIHLSYYQDIWTLPKNNNYTNCKLQPCKYLYSTDRSHDQTCQLGYIFFHPHPLTVFSVCLLKIL